MSDVIRKLRWRTSITDEPHLHDARVLVVILQYSVIRDSQVLQHDTKGSMTANCTKTKFYCCDLCQNQIAVLLSLSPSSLWRIKSGQNLPPTYYAFIIIIIIIIIYYYIIQYTSHCLYYLNINIFRDTHGLSHCLNLFGVREGLLTKLWL